MKPIARLASAVLACLGILAAPSAPAAADPSMAAAGDAARITMLYDAFGTSSTMKKDWGFSAYIEYGGKRILFDTGNDAEIFAHNVAAKGIDLGQLDFAVVSHRHGDHTSGLNHLTKVNPQVPIYVPKENFSVFGAALPGKFLKPNEALPPEMRYFDGQVPARLQFGSAWPAGNFKWVTENVEVAPGFHLILLKGPWGVDLEVMEVSLAIDTPEGIVLVVGCSHPTLEKVVDAARSLSTKPIHLIVGGTHLLPAKPDEIRRIALRLRDELKVDYIAPVHCTGEAAFGLLREAFADRYVYAGLGTTITLGATVTAMDESGQAAGPGMYATEDLREYDLLMAQSDDNPLRMLAHGTEGFLALALASVR